MMILDRGVCSVFARHNMAEPGFMPQWRYTRKTAGWYGVRSFSSIPSYIQKVKETTTIALSIRMLQDLSITNLDTVVLMDTDTVPAAVPRYQVVRVFHGVDDETGVPISDIDLEVVEA